MPVLTCGGMRYQHKWNDVPPEDIPKANQENLEATIHRALELGINHIETARGYGTSEMQLGWVLPKISREKLIVQTKVAPAEDPQEFLSNFNKSMDYLKLDHVDLLSIHGINNRELLEQTIRPGGCLEIARQLQRDGRANHIGFSTHASVDVIQDAINTGEFDYVNLHWYWVNHRNWPAVIDATRHDMGVFIISPMTREGNSMSHPTSSAACANRSRRWFSTTSIACTARKCTHSASEPRARRISMNTSRLLSCWMMWRLWFHQSMQGCARP
jgi:uncharacterized protein